MGYTVVRRLARRTKGKLRVSVEVLVLNFGFARLASSSLFFCMPNDNDGLISGTRKRSHCTICIRTEQRRSNCLIVECFCFDCVAFKNPQTHPGSTFADRDRARGEGIWIKYFKYLIPNPTANWVISFSLYFQWATLKSLSTDITTNFLSNGTQR